MSTETEYFEDGEVDNSEPAGGELEQQFKCQQCGAKMKFVAGSFVQACPYCEFENAIPQSAEDIEELDFHAYLNNAAGQEEMEERLTIKCASCAAESTFDANLTSHHCPFCGMDIVATAKSSKLIKPKSLLPFHIERKKAKSLFRKWIKGLWFAPSKLKKISLQDTGLNGMYVPYWTYDTDTTTFYTGRRGTYYYVTESYRDSEGNRKTRQVRKIRWRFASGTVWRSFDDVLIMASNSLPKDKAQKLEPWDLHNLQPYQDEFLSGFKAESYQLDLGRGFEKAKDRMEPKIDHDIRRDIGGDEQRILTKNTSYGNITFKHILLPIWISAYFYKNKTFRFLVNGRTGEVQGERPWDWVKIILTGTGVAVLIAAIAHYGGAF
jgi:predicted RNA-binding Zn-ribbon protein involved in translation (DUF1610 family)